MTGGKGKPSIFCPLFINCQIFFSHLSLLTMATTQPVRFLPFRSIADPSFWLDHNSHKLNDLKLSEEGVPLNGFFSISKNDAGGMRFDVTRASIRRNEAIRTRGAIYSLNTIESFKKCDKNKFLNDASLSGLLACCGVGADNEVLRDGNDDPNLGLVPSICLTYCDLKSNMTVYWFAFPALAPKPGCGIAYSSETASPQNFLSDIWEHEKCQELSKSFQQFRIAHEKKSSVSENSGVWCPPFFILLENNMRCLPLNKATYESIAEEEKQYLVFGFVDPNLSPDASSGGTEKFTDVALGWTLRNLIAYISLRLGLGGADVKCLSFRPSILRRIASSIRLASQERSSRCFSYQWVSVAKKP